MKWLEESTSTNIPESELFEVTKGVSREVLRKKLEGFIMQGSERDIQGEIYKLLKIKGWETRD